MRGRPTEQNAVRRGRTPASELAMVEEVEVMAANPALDGYAEKPELVRSRDGLSRLWDEVVGDGRAFKPQDVPLLTQMVYWMATANALMEDERDADPNPARRLRTLSKATDYSLKLADHFGCTPMARARLGLTKAATASIGEDIRLKVLAAMEEARGRLG